MNPLVKKYLEEKLGKGYENNQEISDAQSRASVGNAFGDLGDVISGRKIGSTDAYFNQAVESKKQEKDQLKKSALAEYDIEKSMKSDIANQEKSARENNVNSNEAKGVQSLAIEMGMPPEQAKNLTVAAWNSQGPYFQKLYELKVKKEENALKREDSAIRRAELASSRDEKRSQVLQDKSDKKKMAMNEIEDRRQNINENVDSLIKQIDQYGTFELFGAENQNMDRKLDQIATDMAKLMDPASVARPNEVELVKNGLVKPGFKNSNETAKKLLNEFKQEVQRRADNAYSIRGIEKPTQAVTQETKNINGKTYVKVNGGWQAAGGVANK